MPIYPYYTAFICGYEKKQDVILQFYISEPALEQRSFAMGELMPSGAILWDFVRDYLRVLDRAAPS